MSELFEQFPSTVSVPVMTFLRFLISLGSVACLLLFADEILIIFDVIR